MVIGTRLRELLTELAELRESPADGFFRQGQHQLMVGGELPYIVRHDRGRPLLRDFAEHTLIFGGCRLIKRHADHRHFQSLACFPKPLPIATFPGCAHVGRRRDGFLDDLQALSIDLVVRRITPIETSLGNATRTGRDPW